jgi:hypothetical protein
MSVSSECCVLSGGGLCIWLISRPEETFRVWCVWCDREASIMRRPWPTRGCYATKEKKSQKTILLSVSFYNEINFLIS